MDFNIFRHMDNVALAIPEPQHVPLLVQWINNPEVTQFLTARRPISTDSERRFVQSLADKEEDIVFLILVRADEKAEWAPIGVMGAHHIDDFNKRANTGAFIGDVSFQGKGYGVIAKYLMLRYLFEWFGLRIVTTRIQGTNERSIKYNERCGYEMCGVIKEYTWHAGMWHDEVILAVTRERFAKLWDFYQEHKRIATREEAKELLAQKV